MGDMLKDYFVTTREERNMAPSESREKLLEAAGELMIERGSADISLNDIAARSGVNSALVKYYFGNKAGLFMALLRKRLAPGMAELRHLLAMSLSPQDKLRIHIGGMVNTYFHYPYVNRLMHELAADKGGNYGQLIAQEISVPVAEAQRAILEEGRATGAFREVDPLVFYFMVTGACDQLFYGRHQALHVFGIKAIDESLKRRYVDEICNNLLKGISSKEPSAS